MVLRNWELENRRILITGSTGYVGRHLSMCLVKKNKVFGLQRNLPNERKKINGVEYIIADLTDLTEDSIPQDIDCVIHLAAMLDNPVKGPEPPNTALFKTNVLGTHMLLEAAMKKDIPRFIYGSTTGLYGLGPEPFDETAPMAPVNFYHLSKVMTEPMCKWYSKFMTLVILRYSAPYGPGTSNPLLKYYLEQIIKDEPISCNRDGSPVVNPVYIDDAVAITERACTLTGFHVFNVGGPEEISQIELITAIAEAVGKKAQINFRETSLHERGQHLVVSQEHLTKKLDFSYGTSLQEGIPRMVGHTS